MGNLCYPEEFKILAVNQETEKKLPVFDVAPRLGVSTHRPVRSKTAAASVNAGLVCARRIPRMLTSLASTRQIKLKAGEQIKFRSRPTRTGSAVSSGWPALLSAAEPAQIPSAPISRKPKNSSYSAAFG